MLFNLVRMFGSALRALALTCKQTNTGASRSRGNTEIKLIRASTPPAEAPTTIGFKVFGMRTYRLRSRNFPDDRSMSSFQNDQAHACSGFLGVSISHHIWWRPMAERCRGGTSVCRTGCGTILLI
jgi:hypothetical protein